MKPEYTILENGNYLIHVVAPDGLPMFIEMSPEQYNTMYGVN